MLNWRKPPELPAADPFVTQAEAAKSLGVSGRTIRRYAQQGRLRVRDNGTRRDIYREDVDTILRERATPRGIVVNDTTFALLVIETRVMRDQLNEALELLEFGRERLELSRRDILARHRAAVAALAEGPERADLFDWMKFCLRVERQHLDALLKAGLTHPWLPFYELAMKADEAAVGTDYWRLAHAARRNIEAVAGAWIIERGGGVAAFQAASKP